MKASIITLISFFVLSSLGAQNIEKQVVASTGTDSEVGSYQISQTVGESIVTTHTAGDYILCQGFQQKDGSTEVSVKELDDYKFKYYPNPFQDELRIELEETQENLNVQVFSQNGQIVLEEEFKNKNNIKLNLRDISTGIYYVQFNVKNENLRFQIMKLDK